MLSALCHGIPVKCIKYLSDSFILFVQFRVHRRHTCHRSSIVESHLQSQSAQRGHVKRGKYAEKREECKTKHM